MTLPTCFPLKEMNRFKTILSSVKWKWFPNQIHISFTNIYSTSKYIILTKDGRMFYVGMLFLVLAFLLYFIEASK